MNDRWTEVAQARFPLTVHHRAVVEAGTEFGGRFVIARINAGRLPVVEQPSIILKRGETAHLEVPAALMKEVVHRESNPSAEPSQIVVVRAGIGEAVVNVDGPA